MNKKENHSAKSEIEQALLRLMTQKSYLDITVTDIVQEAKVARVSFYRNFASISEVLDSIADATAEKLNIECWIRQMSVKYGSICLIISTRYH